MLKPRLFVWVRVTQTLTLQFHVYTFHSPPLQQDAKGNYAISNFILGCHTLFKAYRALGKNQV